MGEGGGAIEGVGVSNGSARAEADRLLADGHRLEDAGDAEGALLAYRRAGAADDAHARVPLNVANALQKLGRTAEAVSTLEAFIALNTGNAAALFNLGALYAVQAKLEDAETSFHRALQLEPSMAEAAVGLASVLESAQRPDEAEAALRDALAARPGYAAALFNLARLYLQTGRSEHALARLLEIDPNQLAPGAVAGALGELYLQMGLHADAEQAFRQAMVEAPGEVGVGSGLLFSLLFRGDLLPASVHREHVRVGALLSDAAGPALPPPKVARLPADRLRIGYVSGDLFQHPVGRFLLPVLTHHDRDRFEVHCFSNHTVEDDVTRSLRAATGHWHAIAGDDDRELAERIRALGIDVLVDLSGHTTRHRLKSFALRPAPVQVTWLGYLNTTGVAAIDYRICDVRTDPPGETEHLHSERLVRLPNTQWCYVPFQNIPDVETGTGDRTDNVVFGSFNQIVKVTDLTLDLWAALLRRLPSATLRVLDAGDAWAREHLLGAANGARRRAAPRAR